MTRTMVLAALLSLFAAAPASAQARPAALGTWGTVYGLMYTGIAGFHDPGTNSDWVFDDNAFGLGLAALREVSTGLQLGADVSLARTDYERRAPGGANLVEPGAAGTATLGTAMITGRFAYGGAADLNLYLSGGLGTIAYRLEDVGAWNADFALRAATGLEYRFGGRAAFLEWGRIRGYHEREGIGGGSQQHTVLKLGLRLRM
jgi:hypothetical protein